jgi:hypothetical protein
MVQEWCSELFSWEAYVWKCLNCGAIVDPVISRNRGLASAELCVAVGSRR